MPSVFLSPHPDDETLFGAFTLLRHRPTVVVALDCGDERMMEAHQAVSLLGCRFVQWPFLESDPDWDAVAVALADLPDGPVFAPALVEDGNPDHNRIAELAPVGSIRYLTYTAAGKQTDGVEVAYEPEWIGLKHQALACYPSQFAQPGRAEHFMRDIREYTVAA